jgi:rhamnopyranosyl-N-acetylglucosaminyl-diphospho-decaprenol beta-1,3/1,4-galactofuranosyltransferase
VRTVSADGAAAPVVAVVVTHRRQDLLRRCLTAVLGQTRPPEAVVVVDNASQDGTDDLVRRDFPSVDLLVLRRNTGGAGGFAAGLDRALTAHAAGAAWLLDDDTVPEPGALAGLLSARDDYPAATPALVASRVVWTDGREHPMNTPRRAPLARREAVEAAAAVDAVPVRSASFVSVLVDGDAARATGLPVADYFLWNDDFEYTTRLLRGRTGLATRRSTVVHHTRTFGASDADPGPRFYYEVRNKTWLFTRSPGLAAGERLLYGGSSLRRWARTAARSSDRRTLLRAGAQGLRDGLRAGPRPTAEVLAGALPEQVAP